VNLRDFGQPWIPTDKRSGLRTHTAATESVSLYVRIRSYRLSGTESGDSALAASCLDEQAGWQSYEALQVN